MVENIYLAHHGVKGMRWGVRRYQNPDGSLTNAGRKRYGIIKRASDYASRQEIYNRRRAEETLAEISAAKKDPNSIENIYKNRDNKRVQEKWLTSQYGTSWRDPKYMKDVWEISDVHKHAKEDIEQAYQIELRSDHEGLYNAYVSSAEKWLQKKNKFLNTPISNISKKDLKEAKKYAKKQILPVSLSAQPGDRVIGYNLEEIPVTKSNVKEINPEYGIKKTKSYSSEKQLINDMLKTYDKSDPDADEAIEVLKEIKKSKKR